MKKFLMMMLALTLAICSTSLAICAYGADEAEDKPLSLAEMLGLLAELTAGVKTQAFKAFPDRFDHPSAQLDADALAQAGDWFSDLHVVTSGIANTHAMQEASAASQAQAQTLAAVCAMINDMSAPMAILTDPDMYKGLRQRYKLFSWWDRLGRDALAWIGNLYGDGAGSSFRGAIQLAGSRMLRTNKEDHLDSFNEWAADQIKLPNFFSHARVTMNDDDVMTVELKLSANTMSSLRNVRDYYKETIRLESAHRTQRDAIKKAFDDMNAAAKKHLGADKLPVPQLQNAWEDIADVMERAVKFYYDHWEGYITPFAGDYKTMIEEFKDDGDFYSDPISYVRKNFTGSRKISINVPVGIGKSAARDIEVVVRMLN